MYYLLRGPELNLQSLKTKDKRNAKYNRKQKGT